MQISSASSQDGISTKPSPDEFLIVGLGASAGGIEALTHFFENVHPTSGMAYVVILHLSPSYDSQLATVLQRVAPIPVTQVTERTKIQPDHVYVVPPNQHLEMLGSDVLVSPNVEEEDRRAPIDIFFRTLAEAQQSRAVAVILSGTGANGSMGIKRIKERGGAAFVQNPREAGFNEMPRNAIATNLIDEVLPVADIPAHILAYQESIGLVAIPIEPEQRANDEQKALREVFTQIRMRTGHDFSNYKRATVLRRIERRINVRQLPDLPAYSAFLQKTPDEAQALLKDLLISVTNFFRDQKAFEYIENQIIPRILEGKRSDDQVRIWVAGCATGEEAYSLAILLAERTLGAIDAPKIQIFATDIDETAIAKAREALYTLNDAADVSPERLQRYFNMEGNAFRVRREIREMVLFANHNVIKDPPFSHLDMVTCRNMLIYLNQLAQERVMETLHFALRPGGFLFIGSSESVDGAGDLYVPVSKEMHVYQSREVSSRSFPVPDPAPTFRFEPPRPAPTGASIAEKRALEYVTYSDLHQRLLEEYAPPSVVVNEEYDIVHLSERAGRYFQVVGGEPTNNLLKMVRQELRLELRGALYQALQNRSNVETKNLQVRIGDRIETVNIQVRPVFRETDTARGFVLILFEEAQAEVENPELVITSTEPIAQHLEEELMRTKVQLRSAVEQNEVQIEELKASNEELQAMNEELRSTAEELETSKEELQSINEELITVNQELSVKIEELSHANNNFLNLLASTGIGTIFLDRGFRINVFSPAASRIFNLLPGDFGRPITDITNRLQNVDLVRDARFVLDKLQTIEREVQTDDGEVFLMSLLPYRTGDDRIDGVVITFFDISQRHRAQVALRESEERYRTLFESMDEGFHLSEIVRDDEGRATDIYCLDENPAAIKTLGRSVKGKLLGEVNAEFVQAWRDVFDHTAKTGEARRFQQHIQDSDVWFDFYVFKPESITDDRRFAVIFRNVTQNMRTENALRHSEERLRLVLDSVEDYAIITQDMGGIITGWNSGAERMFEWSAAEAIGQHSALIFTPEDRESGVPEQELQIAVREGRAEDERYHLRKNGGRLYISGVLTKLKDNLGFVKIARDLTARKQAENAVRESETRFRTLSDFVPQIIWVNDANGRANYFNSRWFEFSGLSHEQSEGPGWQAIVHPDDALVSRDRWQRALAAGENFETEYRLRRFDGVYRWHIGRNVPIRNEEGQVTGWFGTATDIHDLKQAEAEVRANGDRFRAMFEQSTVGVSEYDLRRNHLFVNQTFADSLGYQVGELLDMSLRDITHPDDWPHCLHLFKRAIATSGSFTNEKRLVRKDGSIIWISESISGISDMEGRTNSVVAVGIDITARKKAEEELRVAHAELETRVEKRTHELQLEVERRAQLEEDRKQLTQRIVNVQEEERGRISRELHDNLGQHLTAILLGIQALQAQSIELPDGERRTTISGLDRLFDMINDLTGIAHRLAWELRPAALDNVGLEAALHEYVRNWSKLGLEADFLSRIPKGETKISGAAETALYRVTQEALTNVQRHANASQVSVVLERSEDFVTVIIEDNGQGFDVEESAAKKRLGVIGMRERMDLVGGSLEVESVPGQGTTVYARVPLEKEG